MDRIMLVVLDATRYDESGVFNFPGFQKLNKVVSVSNWTLPAITTMVCGLHPLQHKVGVLPFREDKEVVLIKCVEKDRINKLKEHSLFDDYAQHTHLVFELPVFHMIGNGHTSADRVNSNEMEWVEAAQKAVEDKNNQFLILHLKAGHSPLDYVDNDTDDPYLKPYRRELKKLAEVLNGFIDKNKNKFDRIAIAADHGEMLYDVNGDFKQPHGDEYHIDNLHIPVWLYPDPQIPDELYDTRVVYNHLTDKKTPSSYMVVSAWPSYGEFDRLGMTYLHKDKLRTEVYQTEKGWDT